ncbi:HipA domain-containing protein [bacterium]|nr:HipA domain-containing protein [bacterium]
MNRCLICCQPTADKSLYHPDCCTQLFDKPEPPQLPWTWDELNSRAEKSIHNRIAVAGVQPKLSLHLDHSDKENSRLTIVGLEGGLIMKPPVKAYPEMPELEHLVMQLAKLFSIQTAVSGLMPLESGELCYLTKRMDRAGKEKIHMEDMCQITGNMTAQKYRGGSMEKVARMVLRHCSNSGLDAVRLFELTVFCFLTGNSDMHLKNFSLMHYSDGEIELSPAYDLLPTNLLLPEDKEESALTISGKKNKIKWEDFNAWGIDHLQLLPKQIENVCSNFEEAIPKAIEFIPNSFVSFTNQKKMIELIADRSSRLGLS